MLKMYQITYEFKEGGSQMLRSKSYEKPKHYIGESMPLQIHKEDGIYIVERTVSKIIQEEVELDEAKLIYVFKDE